MFNEKLSSVLDTKLMKFKVNKRNRARSQGMENGSEKNEDETFQQYFSYEKFKLLANHALTKSLNSISRTQ